LCFLEGGGGRPGGQQRRFHNLELRRRRETTKATTSRGRRQWRKHGLMTAMSTSTRRRVDKTTTTRTKATMNASEDNLFISAKFEGRKMGHYTLSQTQTKKTSLTSEYPALEQKQFGHSNVGCACGSLFFARAIGNAHSRLHADST
jgi:hypothetical protein